MKQDEKPIESLPAYGISARENQMINLAVDLAEKQLREGTASAQVITHFLKLGSTKNQLEKEILRRQQDLIDAKTENMHKETQYEELLNEAIDAMSRYNGETPSEDIF